MLIRFLQFMLLVPVAIETSVAFCTSLPNNLIPINWTVDNLSDYDLLNHLAKFEYSPDNRVLIPHSDARTLFKSIKEDGFIFRSGYTLGQKSIRDYMSQKRIDRNTLDDSVNLQASVERSILGSRESYRNILNFIQSLRDKGSDTGALNEMEEFFDQISQGESLNWRLRNDADSPFRKVTFLDFLDAIENLTESFLEIGELDDEQDYFFDLLKNSNVLVKIYRYLQYKVFVTGGLKNAESFLENGVVHTNIDYLNQGLYVIDDMVNRVTKDLEATTEIAEGLLYGIKSAVEKNNYIFSSKKDNYPTISNQIHKDLLGGNPALRTKIVIQMIKVHEMIEDILVTTFHNFNQIVLLDLKREYSKKNFYSPIYRLASSNNWQLPYMLFLGGIRYTDFYKRNLSKNRLVALSAKWLEESRKN